MCALLYPLGSARPTVFRRGAVDAHGPHRETTMLYRGSCHCGDVKFEAEGDLQGVMACNCSICRRKGALMWFVPRDHMTLLTPDDHLATYTFNKHVIQHRFCKRCGIHVRRGRPPERHRDGRDQRALSRGCRYRRAAGHALRRPLALSGAPAHERTHGRQDGCAVAAPGAGVSACGRGRGARAGRAFDQRASAGAIDFSNCTAIALVKS